MAINVGYIQDGEGFADDYRIERDWNAQTPAQLEQFAADFDWLIAKMPMKGDKERLKMAWYVAAKIYVWQAQGGQLTRRTIKRTM